MRKIKFRAWDKEEKRMFPVISFANVSFGNYENPERYEIMEYTGLDDKNGKEIYEGDIVKLHPTSDACVVEFGEQSISHDFLGVGFYTKEKDGSQGNIFGGSYVEIIGNIYKNPELLK
jgi:uncharacterized phage protein (TIGR01671 family)